MNGWGIYNHIIGPEFMEFALQTFWTESLGIDTPTLGGFGVGL